MKLSTEKNVRSRVFTAIVVLLGAVLLLGILAVIIDERCSRHETEWARDQPVIQEILSAKPSEGD